MSEHAQVAKQMGDYLEAELKEAEESRHPDDDSRYVSLLVEPERIRVIIKNMRWLEQALSQH